MNPRSRKFTATAKDGHLSEIEVRNAIAGFLRRVDGCKVIVSIAESKHRRSIRQNRFYFDVVVGMVVEMFRDNGQPVSEEDVHDFLQKEVCKWTKTVIGLDGRPFSVRRSSREKDTATWEEHNEIIRAWAAGFGYAIPRPNEHLEMNY